VVKVIVTVPEKPLAGVYVAETVLPSVEIPLKAPPASPSLKLPLLALPPKLALTRLLLPWQIRLVPTVTALAVAAGFTVNEAVEVVAPQGPSGLLVEKVIVVVPE